MGNIQIKKCEKWETWIIVYNFFLFFIFAHSLEGYQ